MDAESLLSVAVQTLQSQDQSISDSFHAALILRNALHHPAYRKLAALIIFKFLVDENASTHVKSALIGTLHTMYGVFDAARDAIVEYLLDLVVCASATQLRCAVIENLGKIGQRHRHVSAIVESPLRSFVQDGTIDPKVRSASARSLGRIARSSTETRDWLRSLLVQSDSANTSDPHFLRDAIPFAFADDPALADDFTRQQIQKLSLLDGLSDAFLPIVGNLIRLSRSSTLLPSVVHALRSFQSRTQKSPIVETNFNGIRKLIFLGSEARLEELTDQAIWIVHLFSDGSTEADLLLKHLSSTSASSDLSVSIASAASFVRFHVQPKTHNIFEWRDSREFLAPMVCSTFKGRLDVNLSTALHMDDLRSLVSPAGVNIKLAARDSDIFLKRSVVQRIRECIKDGYVQANYNTDAETQLIIAALLSTPSPASSVWVSLSLNRHDTDRHLGRHPHSMNMSRDHVASLFQRVAPKPESAQRPRNAVFALTTNASHVGPKVAESSSKRRKITEVTAPTQLQVPSNQVTPPAPDPHRGGRQSRPTEPCRYWKLGGCREGSSCPFHHEGEPGKRTEICKFFKSGFCRKDAACPFSHDLSQVACNNILLYNKCVFGAACKFSHDEAVISLEKQRLAEEESEVQRVRTETEARERELRALPFLTSPFAPSQEIRPAVTPAPEAVPRAATVERPALVTPTYIQLLTSPATPVDAAAELERFL